MVRLIIFTDLDGTLLDKKSYSHSKALPAIRAARKKKIPIVFCTSKTRVESELYRRKMRNKHPFIVENGGAIFIPENYFGFKFKSKKKDGYHVIELGTERKKLITALKSIKGAKTLGFSDMTTKELAKDSDLSILQARLAKKREYTEPFKLVGGSPQMLNREIRKRGLNLTKGGRYYHIMGGNDKGKAVTILLRLYKKEFKKISSMGLGDAENDKPMLRVVDKGFMVKGPSGWNKIVLEEIL